MTLNSISRTESYFRLTEELGFSGDTETTRDAVFAEHIRSAVYGYAGIHQTGITSVKLSAMLKKNLSSFSGKPFSFEDETEILKEFGDIYKFCNIRWLPVAAYSVRVNISTAFIVSGMPSKMLSRITDFPIKVVGHMRLITGDFSKLNGLVNGLVVRDFENWVGLPYTDVHDWANLYFQNAESRMESEVPPGDFIWYNGRRWSSLSEIDSSRSEVLLARRSHFWVNEYCLIRCRPRDGTIYPYQFCNIEYDDAKRLQIILSQWKRLDVHVDKEFVTLFLKRKLPFPERKILLLGQKRVSSDGDGLLYRFYKELWPLVEISLNKLGFDINNKKE